VVVEAVDKIRVLVVDGAEGQRGGGSEFIRAALSPLAAISAPLAPGAPPEQFSTISPTRSLNPSTRTIAGTAAARQFTPAVACPHATPAAASITPMSRKYILYPPGRIL
jgi:hypothetical protein